VEERTCSVLPDEQETMADIIAYLIADRHVHSAAIQLEVVSSILAALNSLTGRIVFYQED